MTGMIYRHPAVLAHMAATVDIISAGRLELGLGTGWSEREAAAYGLTLGSWTERYDRFDEGVECIVDLFRDEEVTMHGKYYDLNGARLEPKPLHRARPADPDRGYRNAHAGDSGTLGDDLAPRVRHSLHCLRIAKRCTKNAR